MFLVVEFPLYQFFCIIPSVFTLQQILYVQSLPLDYTLPNQFGNPLYIPEDTTNCNQHYEWIEEGQDTGNQCHVQHQQTNDHEG